MVLYFLKAASRSPPVVVPRVAETVTRGIVCETCGGRMMDMDLGQHTMCEPKNQCAKKAIKAVFATRCSLRWLNHVRICPACSLAVPLSAAHLMSSFSSNVLVKSVYSGNLSLIPSSSVMAMFFAARKPANLSCAARDSGSARELWGGARW